ncbi:putative alpha/Beta hydrolase [Helianthus anomalus]
MLYFLEQVRQQGEYESLHRDLNIGFGTWEFDPTEIENPFPENEGSVHIWQGDEDIIVDVTLQRYIAQQLPWINYQELMGAGHMFPYADGNSDAILKALLLAQIVNYWWPCLPSNLSQQAFSKQFLQDQWSLRVAHRSPSLTYWCNTQKWFPSLTGDEGILVLVTLQWYIAQQLPWINYHELTGASHMFPYADGNSDAILKALLLGQSWFIMLFLDWIYSFLLS